MDIVKHVVNLVQKGVVSYSIDGGTYVLRTRYIALRANSNRYVVGTAVGVCVAVVLGICSESVLQRT